MARGIRYFLGIGFVFVMSMIVLHTPIVMFLGMVFPNVAEVVKGWKELALVLIALACFFVLLRNKNLKQAMLKDQLIAMCILFVVLHMGLSFYHFQGWHAYLAGLANDLRYVIVLVVAIIATRLMPNIRKFVVYGVTAGAVVVGLFGILQLTVLPHDALKNIGYSWEPGKVAPYITVDKDDSYIRIGSTLRGPNPLGFYSATFLVLAYAWLVGAGKQTGKLRHSKGFAAILMLVMFVCLWFSYSRGGMVAAVGGIMVVSIAAFWGRYRKLILVIAGALMLMALMTVAVLRHTAFVETVVFHDSPTSVSASKSNEGHIDSLKQGLELLVVQPLGAGIGSSGSASYYSTSSPTLYIENQYLYIAHESGWLGLLLFGVLFTSLLVRLWARRHSDYLALGLFASGVGLAITSFVLPVWSDDVIAYVWWGLAGIAIAQSVGASPQSLTIARRFVNWNRKASSVFDSLFLPKSWRIDGLAEYREAIIPPLLDKAKVIHDVGGGKIPYVGSTREKRTGQVLIGFDIDLGELERAPSGTYDSWVVGDIGSRNLKKPAKKADLVICQVTLEHVKNNNLSIKNIVSNTKKEGVITLFVPSRNASFALLNRLIPQSIKEKILFSIFPETRHAQGFPAYYHLCTAREMVNLLEANSCRVTDVRSYYQGYYFSFFVPLHIIWRAIQGILYVARGDKSADFYCIVAKKN